MRMRELIDTVTTLMESSEAVSFSQILLDRLQKKYPDAGFQIRDDGVYSDDGKLSVVADVISDPTELAEDDPGLEGHVGVFLWDVATGPYSGVLVSAIKDTTERLVRSVPGSKPALMLGGDNENPEAWKHIATKLGYPIIDEDGLHN